MTPMALLQLRNQRQQALRCAAAARERWCEAERLRQSTLHQLQSRLTSPRGLLMVMLGGALAAWWMNRPHTRGTPRTPHRRGMSQLLRIGRMLAIDRLARILG